MRIIYLGGSFNPSLKDKEALERVQCWLNETNASIMIDCKFDLYEHTIRKQQLADRLRSKWKLIQGGISSAALDSISNY